MRTIKARHPVKICFQYCIAHGCIGTVIVPEDVYKNLHHERVYQVFSGLILKNGRFCGRRRAASRIILSLKGQSNEQSAKKREANKMFHIIQF